MALLHGSTVDNIILCTDSYKISHHIQYPPNTTTVYSYFESRGGKFEKTLFFGLQYILKKWLVGSVITNDKIDEAKAIYQEHFGHDFFNEEGWRYIAEHHGGKLPLKIKSVAEGTVLPYKNVLFTVENTDPKCFWLTNYLETLLVQTWYPMTVSTNSYYQKKIIIKYMKKTSDNASKIPFQLHDFGFRGCSSVESAAIGGLAHLVNFKGTDTIAALVAGKKYYGCTMAGFSIPSSEHSTVTAWGEKGEEKAFRNMLEKFPNNKVGIVSDSYDIFNACENIWGEKLKSLVLERGKNKGRLIVRPDSGDPAETLLKILDIFKNKFQVCKNQKGYLMLPTFLRIIQGDGISYETLEDILDKITSAGWSAENIIFGSGGALLQKIDRDTQKCAYKCSFVIVDGKRRNVFKCPVGDLGKKSKKGLLRLEKTNDGYVTREECSSNENNEEDYLKLVFENGELIEDYSLDQIRILAETPEVTF